jgi:long-chain acyl-CoA synthetase
MQNHGSTDEIESLDEALRHPQKLLDRRQVRWLDPPGLLGNAGARLLYTMTTVAMRTLFRLRVRGSENLPVRGPFIITPNHSSSLDPFALAAALDFPRLSQTCWVGQENALLESPLRRIVNRMARAIPIDRHSAASSLAVAAAVLQRGMNLVWFPEGHRSTDGQLQPFKRGIGILLEHFQVPVVPVYIDGAHAAMPPPRRWPRRLRQITVTFGKPLQAADLDDGSAVGESYERLAKSLHDRVDELRRRGSEV